MKNQGNDRYEGIVEEMATFFNTPEKQLALLKCAFGDEEGERIHAKVILGAMPDQKEGETS